MKKLLAGFGMQSLPGAKGAVRTLPVTRLDLAKMGIPARKIPRIMRELQHAADASPRLEDRVTLLRMARAFAAILP